MTQRSFDWMPTPQWVEPSNVMAFMRHVGAQTFDELAQRADADPVWLMEAVFRFCDFRFYRPYERMLDVSEGIEWAKWCVGGTTNIVLNCLDRHRGTPAWERPFLVWEGEAGEPVVTLTYREFDAEVCALAATLAELGIGVGDRVGLYLPNLPETFIAFFAILKLGAIVVPLFSGFGPQPLVTRLNDAEAKAVLTVDGSRRRGELVPMKAVLDEALSAVPSVTRVLVLRRFQEQLSCPMQPGRDHDWAQTLVARPCAYPTAEMPAEAPAVLLYTSGTTGKPKGCVWTHVSFLGSMVTRDMHICGDFKAQDRYFFLSDMGWMVGAMCACLPSYFGASLLIAEGAPDYPDHGRFWRLVQDHRVTYLGVAPTLIRGMMRYGDQSVQAYDFSALRILSTAGEPCTEAAWRWLFTQVGKGRLPIINIVGGTEVGGCNFIGTPLHPLRPGSFGARGLGAGVDIVDAQGHTVPRGQVGELVLRNPNIGFTKGLWRDPERYLSTYWRVIPGVWYHGDLAMQDEDGLFYILGRSDDTIKIAGKRTGPAEIETLLTASGKVAEAAAVSVPDEIKGEALVCLCVPMPGVTADEALAAELEQAIVVGMGASYRPKAVLFVEDLPKTRNMKIIRRVIKALLRGSDPGDLSALVNPEALEEVRRKIAAIQGGKG